MKRVSRWIVSFCLAFGFTVLDGNGTHPLPVLRSALANQPSRTPASSVKVEKLQVTIAKDPADIYLPKELTSDTKIKGLSIALMLPGALVDRAYYSQFARAVAVHGFAVVVPTHKRSIPQLKFDGELSEASQITATLAFLKQENSNPKSLLYRKLNPSRMALLGHSHGGFVGLQAIANSCLYPFCSPPFTRPDEVKVGVFYGVNSQDPKTGKFSPTANHKIPVALVQGSLDGVATPEEAISTYNLIQTPPKALITIKGSNHYGITNLNNPPGALPDRSSPTLEQSQGVETIAQWTAYFLRTHLNQDADARKLIYDNTNQNPSVTIISVPK